MAPNVNSFRRLRFGASKPFNVGWGYDNRIAGLRVPDAPPRNRRVENRLPGSDTNPYLTIAATLAAGYLGMTKALEPSPPVEGEETGAFETLPLDLRTALEQFETSDEAQAPCSAIFSSRASTKSSSAEYDAYSAGRELLGAQVPPAGRMTAARLSAGRYAQHDGVAPTWYEASARTNPAWPALEGDKRADVCVIGGGYTGLSCALHLAERGFSTLLLEARRIGNGASGRNGGQLGSGHRRDQSTLERELGARPGAAPLVARRGGEGAGAHPHRPARD